MKKTVCIVLCLVLFSSCLVGCIDSVDVQGLQNYSTEQCEFGVADFLPNTEMLWETYDYIEGNYYYKYFGSFLPIYPDTREMALLYLKYDDVDYEEVKSFVLENIVVEEERTYFYNGYHFCEDMSDYYETSSRDFPFNFTVTGYHDEKKIIIFLGIRHYPHNHKQGDQALNELANDGNIQPFLEVYFPMYDFAE